MKKIFFARIQISRRNSVQHSRCRCISILLLLALCLQFLQAAADDIPEHREKRMQREAEQKVHTQGILPGSMTSTTAAGAASCCSCCCSTFTSAVTQTPTSAPSFRSPRTTTGSFSLCFLHGGRRFLLVA